LLNKLLAQMTVALYACRDGYCDLPCNTARLAHHSAFKVIQVIDFNAIWKPVFDFLLVIDSNLGPILHRLVTIHPLQRTTDDDVRQPCKTPTVLLSSGAFWLEPAFPKQRNHTGWSVTTTSDIDIAAMELWAKTAKITKVDIIQQHIDTQSVW